MGSIEELDKAFDRLLERFPEKRRELVERAGEKMYQRILRNIDSDVKEGKGNLRAACRKYIGSGGGYAAVRNDGKKAPHTHLVENGHRIVKGKKKKTDGNGNSGYIKGSGRVTGWVNGKHMYRNAMNELEGELIQEAENMITQTLKEAGFS